MTAGDGRSRAPPLRFYISAEKFRGRFVNRPYGVLSKQEGVIKGETRCCPLEIASARSADKHVSAETCAIENPTTACVGTLRKHAGGMFLVPTTAAMPRGGNREGRGMRFFAALRMTGTGGRDEDAEGRVVAPYGVLYERKKSGDSRNGKHAGGMFLVPTAAAVPRGGNREGRGTRFFAALRMTETE
jgi:hypothetical protein